jgi:hypothetical protein
MEPAALCRSGRWDWCVILHTITATGIQVSPTRKSNPRARSKFGPLYHSRDGHGPLCRPLRHVWMAFPLGTYHASSKGELGYVFIPAQFLRALVSIKDNSRTVIRKRSLRCNLSRILSGMGKFLSNHLIWQSILIIHLAFQLQPKPQWREIASPTIFWTFTS